MFGYLSIDLTGLPDTDSFARFRYFHTRSHLTTDYDVLFQQLDRIILRVIVIRHIALDALVLAVYILKNLVAFQGILVNNQIAYLYNSFTLLTLINQ